MKKLYSLIVASILASTAFAQTWNFSSSDFSSLPVQPATITETTTVSGLTMYASASAVLTYEVLATAEEFDGFKFTGRLKTGGTGSFSSGSPVARVLEFTVTGPKTITIYAKSQNTSTDRTLNVGIDNNSNIIGTAPAPMGSIAKTEITDMGTETRKILIWSLSSGISIYYVSASTPTKVQTPSLGNIVSTEYYSLTGVLVAKKYADLKPGIYLQKSTFDTGKATTVKISKTRP